MQTTEAPSYSAMTDCLTYFVADEPGIPKQLDSRLTVYLGENGEVIGIKISGVWEAINSL